MFHLDSNVVIGHLRGRSPLVERVAAHAGQLAVSAIVLAELRHGAYKSADPQRNHVAIAAFIDLTAVVPVTAEVADLYGRLRTDLERAGRMTADLDLLIAATAIAHDAVLVTHNVKHFDRIPGLRIEDWQAE